MYQKHMPLHEWSIAWEDVFAFSLFFCDTTSLFKNYCNTSKELNFLRVNLCSCLNPFLKFTRINFPGWPKQVPFARIVSQMNKNKKYFKRF